VGKKRKNKNKKRQHEAKPSNIEPREPAAVVQPAQATIKYESGLDAMLRRAREKALKQLRGDKAI
jgi:hypothetical protein